MSTLRTVAQLAGVSPATVSRAFSRPDLVTEETRQRVIDAADSLSWRPSQTARSLALGRTGNIALVVPDMSNPIYGDALKVGHAYARERGFAIFSVHSDGSSFPEREVVSSVAEKADGIVLLSPRMDLAHVQELNRLRPVALVNRSFPGIPGAIAPTQDGMRELVDHLAAQGHHRIAYLAGPSFSIVNDFRESAFRDRVEERGLDGVVLGEITRDFLTAGAASLDAVDASGVTAVVAYSDMVAVGLMGELHRRGRAPGPDLAVAGFDGSWLCETTVPALTSVAVPFSQAVEYAIDDVIRVINGEKRTETRYLTSSLVVRESTPARS